MKNSRTSLVNIPLFKNIIKNNLFPAKVSLIIFAGVFILSTISYSGMVKSLCMVVFGISAVVLTVVYPCFIQSYQVNKTKSTMISALPLETKTIWFTNYLAGYLLALVPLLIEGVGIIIILLDTEMIRFIPAIFMLLFVYYTLTYFVCSLTGSRLGQVVFSLVTYALPLVMVYGLMFIEPILVPGVQSGVDNALLGLSFPLAAGGMYIFNDDPYIFVHVALAVIVLIASYFVYKNRENEYIGEPLVYHKINIILKVILVLSVTITLFIFITIISFIDITFGIKGTAMLLMIYLLIGVIVAVVVEVIFKGNNVYRNLLVYLPVLTIVFGASYLVANHHYLASIEDEHYVVESSLLVSNNDDFGLYLDDEASRALLTYISEHRDNVHYAYYDEMDCVTLTVTKYQDKTDKDIYDFLEYYIDRSTVVDYFNNQGNKYLDKSFNNVEEISKEKVLTCYVDDYLIYLNEDEVKQLTNLISTEKINPEDMFKTEVYQFCDINNKIHAVTINEAITNFILSDELTSRARFIEQCTQIIMEFNGGEFDQYEEQIKEIINQKLNGERIDSLYTYDDDKLISFNNDVIVYEVNIEGTTDSGNSYPYVLEITFNQSNGKAVISDIKVGD